MDAQNDLSRYNFFVVCQQNIYSEKYLKKDLFSEILICLNRKISSKFTLLFIALIAVFFRVVVGLGPYSGYNDPPQYGDYEAQRHWQYYFILNTIITSFLSPIYFYYYQNKGQNQPITHPHNSGNSKFILIIYLNVQYCLNIRYIETPFNDLKYWRIDYPPLTAYISWICGYFSNLYDPKSIELFESRYRIILTFIIFPKETYFQYRGFESSGHKAFMRLTVLILDLAIFIPSIILCVNLESKKFSSTYKNIIINIALLCPPFIFIDHGHFQYNCVMLGLTLLGKYSISDINRCPFVRLILNPLA
ncbi:hypothetical protein PPERSA_11426 [Pseudocohnilembus persalinus]|uniref:Alpha-1,3-glucosyltransferase n=1 Tax=Pseudocohnilembus persalinus TaxID=266149 RepID=A0A0V0QPR3_PSEPJ|nr:hypothetical protein PPERSA_11426 [Pseudocohnilembus persalinus]|eukprot:KRX04302.1 hypothetical protein PPERSA_11426 [Pseudocohnilembus persalinus]